MTTCSTFRFLITRSIKKLDILQSLALSIVVYPLDIVSLHLMPYRTIWFSAFSSETIFSGLQFVWSTWLYNEMKWTTEKALIYIQPVDFNSFVHFSDESPLRSNKHSTTPFFLSAQYFTFGRKIICSIFSFFGKFAEIERWSKISGKKFHFSKLPVDCV